MPVLLLLSSINCGIKGLELEGAQKKFSDLCGWGNTSQKLTLTGDSDVRLPPHNDVGELYEAEIAG